MRNSLFQHGMQVHAFLKEHSVHFQYCLEDLGHYRQIGGSIPIPQGDR